MCVCVRLQPFLLRLCFQRAVPSGLVLLCEQWKDKVHEVIGGDILHTERTQWVFLSFLLIPSLTPTSLPPSCSRITSSCALLFLSSLIAWKHTVSRTDRQTYRSSGNTWFPTADGLCPVLQWQYSGWIHQHGFRLVRRVTMIWSVWLSYCSRPS